MAAVQRVGIQLPRARWIAPPKNRTISRAKRSAAMPGWARQAARSLPTTLRRGMCRAPECAERRGIRYNAPGILSSTPGIDRACDRAERRGMRLNSPGMRDMLEPAKRRGMRYNSPGILSSTPGTGRACDRAERRGMEINSPGNDRESELAD